VAYREPTHIQEGTWGAILCIDPHGIRDGTIQDEDLNEIRVTPGPYYYLLDTLQIYPGLTDRSGYFVATINDNKMDVDSYTHYGTKTQYRYIHVLGTGVYDTGWYDDRDDALDDRRAWLSANPSYQNAWQYHTREVIIPVGDSKSLQREYDYTLFHPSKQHLLNNDEFWIGVQEGVLANGKPNTWAEGAGGRQWLMGGWISRREWSRDGTLRITGTIHGQDYTHLWRQQPIGTTDRPRSLKDKTCDIAQLAVMILTDVNDLQTGHVRFYDGAWIEYYLNSWKFTAHPTYFPQHTKCTLDINYYQSGVNVEDPSKLSLGDARIFDDLNPVGETLTINSIAGDFIGFSSAVEQLDGYHTSRNATIMMESEFTGYTWTQDIKLDNAFDLMSTMCEQADYEWQIMLDPSGGSPQDTRKVCFYPRGTAPSPTPPMIRWETNVRSAPNIQTGNTTDLITNLITLNGVKETIPRFTSAFMLPHVWNDLYDMSRKYSMYSLPTPPNAAGGPSKYGDSTLVIDDEGYPAVNFQRQGGTSLFFAPMLYYTDPETNDPAPIFDLNVDLREWRRLKFKFRHATRIGAPLNEYTIWLCTRGHVQTQPQNWWKSAFYYDYSSDVTDSEWTAIDIELPSIDADGVVIDMNGWVAYQPGSGPAIADVTADPTEIDFIILEANCSETPGYVGSTPLASNAWTGEFYIEINNPEEYFVHGQAPDGEVVFSHPKPTAYLGTEYVVIDAINGDYPGDNNVRLTHYLSNNKSAGTSLNIVGGKSISYSQLRFEKNTFVQYSKPSILPTHLENPKRYRVSGHTDLELVEEAKNNADHEAMVLGRSQQFLQISIDGDPRYMPGFIAHAGLDYDRWIDGETDLIFHYVDMMIDSAEFVVLNTDFYITLNLSSLESRNFENLQKTVTALLAKESRPNIRELR